MRHPAALPPAMPILAYGELEHLLHNANSDGKEGTMFRRTRLRVYSAVLRVTLILSAVLVSPEDTVAGRWSRRQTGAFPS
jgi:hypothetical protein